MNRQEAKQKGLTRYFEGHSCKNGHIAERMVGNGACIVCIRQRNSIYKRNNPDKVRKHARDGYWRNPELFKKRSAQYRKKNPQKVVALNNLRRAKKLKATPPWVNKNELRSIYVNCPKGMEVDHVIPLIHSLVCGLHVPWNLQYLTPSQNRRKSNSW